MQNSPAKASSGVLQSSSSEGAEPKEDAQELLKERDALRQILNDQLTAIGAHTSRITALEQDLVDMQSATRLASQVGFPICTVTLTVLMQLLSSEFPCL